MKRKTGLRLLAVLFGLALALGLLPGMRLRAYAGGSVSYIKRSWDSESSQVKGTELTCENYEAVAAGTTNFAGGQWYVVNGNVEINDRITVTGTANLILTDGSTLTARKGIAVNDPNGLNIYAQSEGTGELVVTESTVSDGCAAIGGDYGKDSGPITIHGGNLTVTGGSNAAAIGGGMFDSVEEEGGSFTSITVYGGTIDATSGEHAGAAIGTGNEGCSSNGDMITIYGGTVNAEGVGCAAGIGGGTDEYESEWYGVGTVTIYGGTVKAKGGDGYPGMDNKPAGIGAAAYRFKSESVFIYGGTVTGIGGSANAAGIGKNYNPDGAEAGSINLGENVKLSHSSDGTTYTKYESEDYSVRERYMKAEVPHTHSWSYAVESPDEPNKITATCRGTGACDITGELTLTISAPTGELVCDGTTTYPAMLSTDYNKTAFPGDYVISYTRDGSAYDGEPKDAGEYTASVTVGETTASVSFTIAEAPKPEPAPEPEPKPEPAADAVPIHRLYNPNSGEHFYTASDAERDNLVSLGWRGEGDGWTAPAESDTPVYRLYNGNAGEHHYTASAAERDALVAAGWSDEGIGWYSDDARGVAVCREYNPNAFACNHNYTANQAEHDLLVKLGWDDEGVAWYGLAA